MISDPTAFILANTRLQPVPHAPEVSLWLADEVTPIWRLTEEELGEMGLPPPFWAFAWAGGQGLARWLLDNPAEVAGKRVLDLAAGSGLVGIAAIRAGAASALGGSGGSGGWVAAAFVAGAGLASQPGNSSSSAALARRTRRLPSLSAASLPVRLPSAASARPRVSSATRAACRSIWGMATTAVPSGVPRRCCSLLRALRRALRCARMAGARPSPWSWM